MKNPLWFHDLDQVRGIGMPPPVAAPRIVAWAPLTAAAPVPIAVMPPDVQAAFARMIDRRGGPPPSEHDHENERGRSCSLQCARCAWDLCQQEKRLQGYERSGKVRVRVIEPLDAAYDGVSLRLLLEANEKANRENICAAAARRLFTPAQRDAVSAHWSKQVKLRVNASKAADKAREVSVYCDGDWVDEGTPW